jgi:hypothetical protein
MTEENLSNFNKEFFEKIKESNIDYHDSYINKTCKEHNISDNQEIKALIVFFYWNHYLNKLFPNIRLGFGLNVGRHRIVVRRVN